jgi:hypothetical protein
MDTFGYMNGWMRRWVGGCVDERTEKQRRETEVLMALVSNTI